jgi:hypothetical protein
MILSGNIIQSGNLNSFSIIPKSGLFGAYSVRKLLPKYSGNCLRVRRSSDDGEQDFGFVSNFLDTASILTFVGAGNGFITKWYKQGGNAADAINLTAAVQPKIVDAGLLRTINGIASPFFGDNTSETYLEIATVLNQPCSVFAVAQSPGTDSFEVILDSISTVQANRIVCNNGGVSAGQFLDAGSNLAGATTDSNLNTNAFIANGVSSEIFRNGVSEGTGDIGSNDLLDGIRIGNNDNKDSELNGYMPEILIYSRVATDNEISFIHNNQKHFFGTL